MVTVRIQVGRKRDSRRPGWRATSHGNISDLGGIHSTANGSGGGGGRFCERKKRHESQEEESDEALEEHCESGFRRKKSEFLFFV